jgi:NitT/TauT family transport system permease protein
VRTVISLLAGLGLWELVSLHASQLVFASLQDIWSQFIAQARSGALGQDAITTFTAFAIGFLIASSGGILIGLLMATSDLVFDLLDPWVSAMRSTPLITLAPLFIVVFGISTQGRVAIVTLVAIFPVIINTADGIRTTDPALIECANAFGAGRLTIFKEVLLPSALPFIVSGLRLGVSQALIGVVVAEFFGSHDGLGFMVFEAAQNFNTGTVYVGVFILAATGTILTKLMYRLERSIAPWREFDLKVSR